MNLEDHLGDIIRKARSMSQTSPAVAARAAELSETELATLEESGKVPGKFNLAALAELVGLHPGKLEALACGWRPASKDLSVWRELRCLTTAAGGMAVNCYVVWDEVSREAALFDTGWEAQPIAELVAGNQLQLRHIFITHSHEDHVAALGELRRLYPKVRLHSGARNAPWTNAIARTISFTSAACVLPTARRPATLKTARRTSSATGPTMLHTSLWWVTHCLPGLLAAATSPGIWPISECVNRFSAYRRKHCFAPAMAR